MGCVYYRWQLVFADIINTVTDRVCLKMYMLYWTPDCTHDLIVHWTLALTDSIHLTYIDYDRHMTCGHLILLLTVFITVHLCLHIISVLI